MPVQRGQDQGPCPSIKTHELRVIICGVKNVTISLDEKTAAWARIYAARRNLSLSRFLAQILDAKMRESRDYDRAMRQYLARKPTRLSRPGDRYPARDELHDRHGLR
jgi:hypothetical protein